jgi:hypothetical protein
MAIYYDFCCICTSFYADDLRKNKSCKNVIVYRT